MQNLYLPPQQITCKFHFEQRFNLLYEGVKPYSPELSFQQKILRSLFFKFSRLTHGTLALEGVSEISLKVLGRSLWEIVIDACYLVVKDDVELWKRYLAFGDLDRIKLKINAVKFWFSQGRFDIVQSEISLITDMLEKCFVKVSKDEKREDLHRILESILKPEKLAELKNIVETLHGTGDSTVLTPEGYIQKLQKAFGVIKSCLGWRGMGLEDAFKAIFADLKTDLEKEALPIYLDTESFSIFYHTGNAAVHSSDTLLFLSYDREAETFNEDLDTDTDYIYICLFLPLKLMAWALYRLELVEKEKVLQLCQPI